ncbi:MAG: hypothetical protein IJ958_02815, partial [Agathobacter sp.]|nr:hypothetical protein [Agathobacter sp.]
MLIVIELVELIGIFTLSNWIVSREKVGYIVNSLLMLLFNIQMVVLYFGNTYVSMIMLSNFHSVEDIMGKASTYGVGVVLVLFFFFLPVAKVNIRTKVVPIIFFVSLLALEWVLMFVTSATNSPLYSYYDIVKQYHNMKQMNDSIQNAMINNDVEQIDENLDKFYKEEIVNYRKKEQSLVDAPNIILIFTEGLSQNVIDDERNNMPNVAAYQKKSLMFDNYYNHTAATYRGLEGQLYSGYQLYDFDTNNLISIQSILSDNGYNTFFFNAEPYNSDFKAYLSSFEFDYL